MMQENKHYVCIHVQRCQNDLADDLAKKGRVNGWDHLGYTFPSFLFITKKINKLILIIRFPKKFHPCPNRPPPGGGFPPPTRPPRGRFT
jgi:hypothetical protein